MPTKQTVVIPEAWQEECFVVGDSLVDDLCRGVHWEEFEKLVGGIKVRCTCTHTPTEIDCFGEAHGVRGMTIGELADQLEGIAQVQKPWPEYLRMAPLRARGRGRAEVWCTQNQ